MGKFFWGLFFIYVNFNLSVNAHALNVLPPFVGYWLLYKGLVELNRESQRFQSVRPFAVGMAVYTAILWCGELLGVTENGNWIGTILGLVSMVVSLYVSWAIIQGVRDMENNRGTDLNSPSMQTAWWVLVISQTVSYTLVFSQMMVFGLSGFLSGLTFAVLIGMLVGIVMLLMAFWRGKKLYEVLPPLSGPDLEF